MVVAVCMFFFYHKKGKTEESNQADVYQNKLLNLESEILINNMQLQRMFEGTSLNRNIVVETEDSNSMLLGELIGHTPKIIFRFTDNNCMACIDSQMMLISKHVELFRSENILLLVSARVKRDIMIKLKQFNIDNQVYFISHINGIELEGYNTPYYFVIDEDCVMNLVFIPSKEIPLLTENYFSILNKRFGL